MVARQSKISFSRGSSRPRDRTQVSHIAGRLFNLGSTREATKPSSTNKKQGDTEELLYQGGYYRSLLGFIPRVEISQG